MLGVLGMAGLVGERGTRGALPASCTTAAAAAAAAAARPVIVNGGLLLGHKIHFVTESLVPAPHPIPSRLWAVGGCCPEAGSPPRSIMEPPVHALGPTVVDPLWGPEGGPCTPRMRVARVRPPGWPPLGPCAEAVGLPKVGPDRCPRAVLLVDAFATESADAPWDVCRLLEQKGLRES